MIRPVATFAFIITCFAVKAQADLGIATMPGIWQAGYANPAVFQEHRFVMSLPGIHYDIAGSGFAWGDLVVREADGRRRLDPDRFIGSLKDRNHLRQQSEMPVFGFGICGNAWFVSAGLQLRSTARLGFPKELAQLLWKGNAQFIGESIPFGPEINAAVFNESFLGLALRPSPKLSIGGRIKLLNGVFNVSALNSRLILTTGKDAYELLLDADYQLNATLGFTYSSLDSIELDEVRLGVSGLFGDNPGLAMDFGIQYNSGPLSIQASILDLGSINWRKDANSLSLNGAFEFKGMDIFQQLIEGNNTGPVRILDSLNALYDIRQNQSPYRTVLPARLSLGTAYALNDFTKGTGTLLIEMDAGNIYTAFALGGRLRAGKWADIGLLYAVRHGRANHLGLNAILNAGPLQIIAATDHIGAFLRPEKARQSNLRLGLNMTFGRIETE
ncbi:MAG: DUF5723 family protein [Saprospiraceae bacterium]